MNKTIMIGRLTKDVELRFISGSGTAVANFDIAVNRDFKKEGQPDADFFKVTVWGKIAESCANYLAKGRLVAVEGAVHNNNYEDKNGVKHYGNIINANKVEFLEWGEKSEGSTENTQSSASEDDGKMPWED